MRLILLGGMTTGIGLAALTIAIFLDPSVAFVGYLVSVVCTGIVVVCAVGNSLTTRPGYVHPDDRLWSNILAYLLTIFTILTLGRFLKEDVRFEWWFNLLFNIGTLLLLALVFVFTLVGLSGRFRLKGILEGAVSEEKSKEIAARLILFALLVGSIMAAVQIGLTLLSDFFLSQFGYPLSYYYSSVVIGSLATLLLFALGIFLRTKYERISDT